jgi:drug/metabolite transporter (DMT)-like permease
VVYVPAVILTRTWPTEVPSVRVIVSVVVLALVCSALAFVVFFALIAEIGPARATAVTYINPAVAILAGALLLGEPVTVWTVVGFVLVIAGSWLVTRRRRVSPPARRRATRSA